jgi:hypothetical protein
MGSFPEAYQANTFSKSFGKGVQDSHGWVKPLRQSIVISLEYLDLLMNEGENGAGRGTVLELSDKWMRKEIVLGTFFVDLQGIVENQLEIGGCGGRGVDVGHERAKTTMVGFTGYGGKSEVKN